MRLEGCWGRYPRNRSSDSAAVGSRHSLFTVWMTQDLFSGDTQVRCGRSFLLAARISTAGQSKRLWSSVVECEALERLTIVQLMNEDQQKRCLELEDAIEFPWACTKIQDLQLTIAIPETPLYHPAEGVVPYYHRPLPTTLSAEETQRFRDLETLYQQLGALTELERLDLRALFFDPSGVREVSDNYMLNTFPGLFSLGKKETGRPGYLQLLGGLTKLKELHGLTCLVIEETEATVGMDEVNWMYRHWVALEKAEFDKGGQEGEEEQECLDVLDWWDDVQQSRREL